MKKHHLFPVFLILFYLFNCDLFYTGFDNNRNRGLIDPGDSSAYQNSLTFDTSSANGSNTRVGQFPSNTNADQVSIRFSELKSGSTLEQVQNVISFATYGDATQTFNALAGQYISIFVGVEPSSQPVTKTFFQLTGADQYVEFLYTPPLNPNTVFRTTFKIPSNTKSGLITARIGAEGLTPGFYSNSVIININVVNPTITPDPPSTVTFTTIQSTVTTDPTATTTTQTTASTTTVTSITTMTSTSTTQTSTTLTTTTLTSTSTTETSVTYTTLTTRTTLTSTTQTTLTTLTTTLTTVTTSSTTRTTTTVTTTTLTTTTLTTTTTTPLYDNIMMIGGTSSEFGRDVKKTSDGGYIVTGYTNSTTGDFTSQGAIGMNDIFVIKLTADGLFDSTFAGDGILLLGSTGNDEAYSIIQTADGGYLLTGIVGAGDGNFSGQGYQGGNDIVVIKLTSTGSLDTGFAGDGILIFGGGPAHDTGECVMAVSGGYVIIGKTSNSNGSFTGEGYAGGTDIVVIKLTTAGNPDPTFGSNGIILLGGTSNDEAKHCSIAQGGEYLITGRSNSTTGIFSGQGNAGSYDIFVIALTPTGSIAPTLFMDGIKLLGTADIEGGIAVKDHFGGIAVVADLGPSSTTGIFAGQGHHGGSEIAVIFMQPDGNLNPSFDSDGVKVIGGGSGDTPLAVDFTLGPIVITGQTNSTTGDFASQGVDSSSIFVVALNPVGAFETMFAGDGIIVINGGSTESANAISGFIGATNGWVLTGFTFSGDGHFLNQGYQASHDVPVVVINDDGTF